MVRDDDDDNDDDRTLLTFERQPHASFGLVLCVNGCFPAWYEL